jgi:tetratricopeptide (TPR) repeat protein
MAQQNQWASAVLEYSRSLTIDTSDYALYKKAECYMAMNRSDSAVSDLDKLAARNQLYRNVYSKRGLAFSRLGKFEKANKDFETAVRQFPDDTSAFYYKGWSEINQKNYKAALVSLEQAVRLAPSDSAYYLLSLASYQERNFDQTIQYSMKARNKHTTKFEVFYICGKAYFDKGDYKSAIGEFAIAKANVSFDPGLWFAHAATLEAMQKYAEASGEYDQLIATVNYRDTANFRSAVCKIKSAFFQDYPRAIVQLDQYIHSLSQVADKSAPYAWKAYSYLCIDSVSQSADAITEAKKYNEKNPVLQLVLACRSTKAQDYESACVFLERALASREFKKEEIEQIDMLNLLKKKNKKYKMLMQQYFP